MSEKKYLTWEKFDSDITDFIDYLRGIYIPNNNTVILGLKRGGLPTAVALSNKLDIPISMVSFQTRDANDTIPKFLEPEMFNETTCVIIPDDIYDSGLTIESIVNQLEVQFGILPGNIIGLFHYNSDNIEKTSLKHYKSMENNQNSWVCFPWE